MPFSPVGVSRETDLYISSSGDRQQVEVCLTLAVFDGLLLGVGILRVRLDV